MSGRILRILCLLLGVGGMTLAGWLYRSYADERSAREADLLNQARFNVLKIALNINGSLNQLVDTNRRLASDLTNGKLTGAGNIEARLELETGKNPSIQAIGVAYEPYAFSAEQYLYAPYYVRDAQGNFQMLRLEQEYDYTKPPQGQDGWYDRVSQLNGTWGDPSRNTHNGALEVIYGLPFYRFDKVTLEQVPAGVVFVALAQADFQQQVRAIDLGDEGYAFIVSGRGNYLVHPDQQLVNTSMADYANRIGDAELAKDVQPAIKEQLILRNGVSGGQPSWYFYEPIPASGWSMGIVLQKDPHNAMVMLEKYSLVRVGLVLIVALILIAIFAFRLRFDSSFSLWAVSVVATLFIIGLVTFTWYLEITRPVMANESIVLSSRAAMTENLSRIDQAFAREGLPPPTRIPTGLFVESFAMDGRRVTLTGYIWQKYPQELVKENQPPGVIFPDVQGESQASAFRYTQDGFVTVGYYFRITQQQTFSAVKYPLDQESISVQLQPASLDKNFLLVPDLDSYNTTNPSSMPGLKPGLLVNNWNILHSAYTYSYEKIGTNFGSSAMIKQYNLPALRFNITMERFILPSMLSYGITAIVISILMFSLVISKADNLRSILTEFFALFFVLVVAHVGLRGELAAQGVVYLETLFIMLYCLTLLGVLNGVLEFVDFKVPLLSYRGGLLFKLLYWPILSGTFLFITLSLFYPQLF